MRKLNTTTVVSILVGSGCTEIGIKRFVATWLNVLGFLLNMRKWSSTY
ncbi:hypothetical protein IFVP22_C1320405 [Vibrio parahaemolyticus]